MQIVDVPAIDITDISHFSNQTTIMIAAARTRLLSIMARVRPIDRSEYQHRSCLALRSAHPPLDQRQADRVQHHCSPSPTR